jgi:hypothetical protein
LSLRDWFAEWCHGNLLLAPVPGWIDFGCVSPLFFGAIASMPIEDFKTTMKDITPNGVIDQLADQTSDNAKIVAQESGLRPTQHRIYYGMTCFFAFIIGRPILLSLVTL